MDKAMLRRQLEAQAAALEEGGPQLCGRLLDACCALVEAAREEAPDPAPLADPEREELLAPALALLDKVNTLALPYAAPKPGSGREASGAQKSSNWFSCSSFSIISASRFRFQIVRRMVSRFCKRIRQTILSL